MLLIVGDSSESIYKKSSSGMVNTYWKEWDWCPRVGLKLG